MWVFFCRLPKDAVPLLMLFHQNPRHMTAERRRTLGRLLKNLLAPAEPNSAILDARITQRLGI
jgi:hypothetical protein